MKRVIGILCVILLGACTPRVPNQPTAIDGMNKSLRDAIHSNANQKHTGALSRSMRQALMGPVALPHVKQPERLRRFDISVRNLKAPQFFMSLVKGTDISMAIHPKVKGSITLSLKGVTLAEALKTVERLYGYGYESTRTGYLILPNTLQTQMFSVNYLELERKGRSNMMITSGQVSQQTQTQSTASVTGSSTSTTSASNGIGDVQTTSQINFWKQLKTTLDSMLATDKDHSVTVNPMAGLVVVRAYPYELKQVARYLDAVQSSVNRQVILEAKILEVILDNRYQMGIDWKVFGAQLNALNDFPNTDIIQSQFPGAFTSEFRWIPEDFTTTIKALETQGNVQVLSSPRVAAMNNQKSVIKVGTDSYFVTNVSSSTTTSSGGSTTPTQDVELTPFFSGITLDVTPQVDALGNVTLHIHPAISEVKDQKKEIDLGESGTLNLPLANSTIRESDTIVHAKTGQVIVIGGLMEHQTKEDVAGLPGFANVPFLGTIFRATKQISRKSELVILLRATVVNRKNTRKTLAHTQNRFSQLDQGFHIGGRPDIFGSEAEKPIQLGPRIASRNQRTLPKD